MAGSMFMCAALRLELNPPQAVCYPDGVIGHIGWSFSIRFHIVRRSKASTRSESPIIPLVLVGRQNERDCQWEAFVKMR